MQTEPPHFPAMKKIAACLFLLAFALVGRAQDKTPPPVQQSLLFNVPFKAGEGYPRYRIPAISVTAKRTRCW